MCRLLTVSNRFSKNTCLSFEYFPREFCCLFSPFSQLQIPSSGIPAVPRESSNSLSKTSIQSTPFRPLKKVHRTFFSYAWQPKRSLPSRSSLEATDSLFISFFYIFSFTSLIVPFSRHSTNLNARSGSNCFPASARSFSFATCTGYASL